MEALGNRCDCDLQYSDDSSHVEIIELEKKNSNIDSVNKGDLDKKHIIQTEVEVHSTNPSAICSSVSIKSKGNHTGNLKCFLKV